MTPYTRQCLTELAFFLTKRIEHHQFDLCRFGKHNEVVTARASLLTAGPHLGIAVKCKTVFCAAGWLIVMYGRELRIEITDKDLVRATDPEVFERVKVRSQRKEYGPYALPSYATLSEALGITYPEAEFIFCPGKYHHWERTRQSAADRIKTVVERHGGPPRQYVPAPKPLELV